jgi:hypothetical protein
MRSTGCRPHAARSRAKFSDDGVLPSVRAIGSCSISAMPASMRRS